MGYLDENGLKILWNKIKNYAGKSSTSDGFQVTTNAIYTSGGLPQIANKSIRQANTTSIGSNGIIMYSPTTQNDASWIRNISNTAESEELEIATGDDGTSDFNIYFRAYNTQNKVVKQVKVPTPDSTEGILALKADVDKKADSFSVTNYAPTLSWGKSATVADVKGTPITVTMPSNPNTDTHYTYGLYLQGNGTTAQTFSQNANKYINFVGDGGTTVSASSGKITITSEKPASSSIRTYTGYLNNFPAYVSYAHVHVLSASYVSSNVYKPLVFTQGDSSGKFTYAYNSYYNNGNSWSSISNCYCKIAYITV